MCHINIITGLFIISYRTFIGFRYGIMIIYEYIKLCKIRPLLETAELSAPSTEICCSAVSVTFSKRVCTIIKGSIPWTRWYNLKLLFYFWALCCKIQISISPCYVNLFLQNWKFGRFSYSTKFNLHFPSIQKI